MRCGGRSSPNFGWLTALLVGDAGRQGLAARAKRLLDGGGRVLAVDPFFFGESKIAERDFVFALLVSAIGDRPLGLQASQLAAVARWSQSEHKSGPVTIVAAGERSSTFALVAAALEPSAIGAVELNSALASMKQRRTARLTRRRSFSVPDCWSSLM